MKRSELAQSLRRLAYCEGMEVCEACPFDQEVCRSDDPAEIFLEAAKLLEVEGSFTGSSIQEVFDVLPKRMAALRMDSGLSLRRLQEALQKYFYTDEKGSRHEVAYMTISGYENGNCSRMKAEVLVWYADFFGVSVDWLLGLTDRRNEP